MPTITYNKLVRDKIPQIIEQSGKTCTYEILADEQYMQMLREKLLEEAYEYLKSGNIEELADISEVVYAILRFHNVAANEFDSIRRKKCEERGGFEKRILLKDVEDYL